jgi:hypothetical protein
MGPKASRSGVAFGVTLISLLSLPCFKANRVLQQPNISKPHRATLGFAFSIAGAILILLRGIVRIIVGDVITFAGSDELRRRFLTGLALNIVGGIAVVFA